MKTNPYNVSTILPVYNGQAFLMEAIESILRQTLPVQEIILVDDGSTDDTAGIAAGYGSIIRYIYQTKAGPAAARNHGLRIAGGDVICFVDADDYWPSSKLEIQLGWLEREQKWDIVLGHIQRVYMTENETGGMIPVAFARPWAGLLLGCGVYRRSVFDTIGFFNEELLFSEDWDWFMRAREAGIPILVIDDVTQFYRQHGSNMTNQSELGQRYMLQMLKNSLDRRRSTSSGQVSTLPPLASNNKNHPNKKEKDVSDDEHHGNYINMGDDCHG